MKSYDRILTQFSVVVGRGPRSSQSDFGGDPNCELLKDSLLTHNMQNSNIIKTSVAPHTAV